ncbi:unnamed protein product, partial [Arabidopsis halleri]
RRESFYLKKEREKGFSQLLTKSHSFICFFFVDKCQSFHLYVDKL